MSDIGHDFARMQDYLVGRLSQEDCRAFEDRLVRDARLVGELERYLRFREGLQQLQPSESLAHNASRRAGTRAWAWGLAAAAVVAAVTLWYVPPLATEGSTPLLTNLPGHAAPSVATTITGQFTFVTTRGGLKPRLGLPAAGLMEMRAAPADPTPATRYRVMLVRERSQGRAQVLGSLSGVAMSADGYLHCYVDASRLTPGDYELHLQPDTGTAARLTVFPFELQAHLTAAFH